MWLKIGIKNLGIFLSSACDFRENRCQAGRTVLMGPNGAQFKLYLCVYREALWYSYLQNKIRFRNVRYVTYCVSEIFFSFIVKVPLQKKRDLPSAQHNQLRAHTVTQTRTPHHSGSWFAARKYFCKDKSKAAPCTPWRYRSSHSSAHIWIEVIG